MNLNEIFISSIQMPDTIRDTVAEQLGTSEFKDIICCEGTNITKKDFKINRIDRTNLFMEGDSYRKTVNCFAYMCTHKKDENFRVLLMKMPHWTNNGMFQHMSKAMAFYHKKYYKKMSKEIGKTFYPTKLSGNMYSSAPPMSPASVGFLNNVQDYIRDDELFAKIYANSIGFLKNPPPGLVTVKRGLMLYGKQGTGKTAIIKDLLKECMREKIYSCIVDPADLGNASSVAELLYTYTKHHKPSVIILEDFDSLVTDRSENIHNDNPILKNLLNFLDGFYVRDKNVVIFSTNYMERIDKALKRPGRLDVFIEFKHPSYKLKSKYLEKRHVGEAKIDEILAWSKNFTWAMVAELVNRIYFEKDRAIKSLAKEIEMEREAAEKTIGFGVSEK